MSPAELTYQNLEAAVYACFSPSRNVRCSMGTLSSLEQSKVYCFVKVDGFALYPFNGAKLIELTGGRFEQYNQDSALLLGSLNGCDYELRIDCRTRKEMLV